jgi:ATP-dependent DNA ligase
VEFRNWKHQQRLSSVSVTTHNCLLTISREMLSSTFLDESGRPSFNALQNYGSSKTPIVYYLFDVLIIAGQDVMLEPLKWRWELLRTRVLSKLDEPIREWTVLEASLPDLIRSVKKQGLEGIVPKRPEYLFLGFGGL